MHRHPTKLGRFTIDPITARKHRRHHRNPKDLRIVMVPFQALFPAAPIAIGLAIWRLDPPQAAMALACGFGMLFNYEWTHYLIHAPYRPKTAWFHKVSRNHRLHHYRSEHFWFGVTTSLGDRVLGTARPERHPAVTDGAHARPHRPRLTAPNPRFGARMHADRGSRQAVVARRSTRHGRADRAAAGLTLEHRRQVDRGGQPVRS